MSAARDPAARFFEDFVALSRRATNGSGLTRALRVADRAVRVSFGSEVLAAALEPALLHLETPCDGAPFELLTWDSTSSGLEPPAPPWEGQGFAAWTRARAGREHAVQVHLCGHGTFSLFDRDRRLGVYWVRSAERIPPWDRAAPFRSIFGMRAPSMGGALLHAAAVGDARGALLLTGKGGSGKSTTAVSCLLDGMGFLGEDYVLVSCGETPQVHNLYGTAKLDTGTFERLFAAGAAPPLLDPGPRPEAFDHHKRILLLRVHHGGALVAAAPVCAIVVTYVSDSGRTSLSALPAPAVLRALAPTTLLQLPGSGARDFARLAAIARALPGYALELGDRAQVVAALRGLLHTT